MARVRKRSEDLTSIAGQVPAELKDHDAEVWRDPVRYRRWCDLHLGGYAQPLQDEWYFRHSAAVRRWAEVSGLMSEQWPKLTDVARLKALGITNVSSRRRFEGANRIRAVEYIAGA